ncbi:glutathione S-transferase family protein [Aurantiacibacter rhizosphaerae]|nr:glutathione S-transferase family protein [Aurantiacibacter rhizosphaerae]
MTDMKLYHLPGACSRVTLTALEQCGADYTDEIVLLMRGAQHSPQYRAINPKGKIPCLIVDGQALAENAAILSFLNMEYPAAALFPQPGDALEAARQTADLFALSASFHPSVRAMMMPVRWTTGNPEEVREKGRQLVHPLLQQLETRLATQPWWYGGEWSIIDSYAHWNYTTAQKGQFDLSPYPNIAQHQKRVEAHPAYQRALAREQAAVDAIGGLPDVA